jgi:flavin reductase (DIM6/NTAB) family NADH-FMN oxidoreductase RutF
VSPAQQEHLFEGDEPWAQTETVPLRPDAVWNRVLAVAPLVLVGSKESDGRYDLAPKHMAMPLGWGDRYCFVCTPRHATYRNVEREGAFTVSFPHRFQVVQAGLAAAARDPAGRKPNLAALPTFPATTVDGVLVHGCYLFLECELDRLVAFGDEALVVGRIVAASARPDALLGPDADESEVVRRVAPIAYLSPGRFAGVAETRSFPFPADFSR